MDQALHHMPTLSEAKNSVEIVVHISESLDDVERNNLVVALEGSVNTLSHFASGGS